MNKNKTLTILILIILTAVVVWMFVLQGEKEVEAEAFQALLGMEVKNGVMFTYEEFEARPTLVVAWTTWCPTCLEELLYLKDHYDEINSRVNLVAVNLTTSERNPGNLDKYLTAIQVPFVVLSDTEGKSREHFASRFVPSSFLLNSKGKVVKKADGPVTVEMLENWLSEN
ncbi:MAG: TlpA disulfide reductase family protein [Bacillota bacterium]